MSDQEDLNLSPEDCTLAPDGRLICRVANGNDLYAEAPVRSNPWMPYVAGEWFARLDVALAEEVEK